jgi:endoglycosylceramidase
MAACDPHRREGIRLDTHSHRARRRLGALACIALGGVGQLSGAAPAAATTAPASADVTGQLGHAGRWIVDAQGRVVLVHGVNVPTKSLPAYPAALNFGDDDAALLQRLGFNAVRLTVERYAVEPSPGRFDAAYVAQFASTMRTLAAHGIRSLLDFHQDDYGPVFWDNGYPDWMTVTDGLPNLFFSPFPTQYFDNPALNRAFDHLWADDVGPSGRPLQEDDGSILAYVATQLRSAPGLLGYEIINEPWPGTQYPQCVQPGTGCKAFDQGAFSAYYRRVATAIRAADPDHLVWYEPLVTFNQGVPTYVTPPPISDRGFAFHDYSICGAADDAGSPVSAGTLCQSRDQQVLSNAEAFSASSGDPLLETEWGATMNTSTIATLLDEYDQAMVPWLFWSYTRYVTALDAGGKLKPATDGDVNWSIAGVLSRPYPQLVSGTPQAWSYDPASQTFTLRYSTARAGGGGAFVPGAETDVAVPQVAYPHGYGVSVSGGRGGAGGGGPGLGVVSCPGGTVSITVSPALTGMTSTCGSAPPGGSSATGITAASRAVARPIRMQ